MVYAYVFDLLVEEMNTLQHQFDTKKNELQLKELVQLIDRIRQVKAVIRIANLGEKL